MKKYGPPEGHITVLKFLLKYKKAFIVSTLAGILYNTVIVLGPIFLGQLIDAAASTSAESIFRASIHFVGITIIFQFARVVKRWYMRDQFNHVACDMRQTLLDHILGFDLPQFEKETVGDLMSRTIGDVSTVVDTVMSTINESMDTWVLMISYFTVLMFMDLQLTLVASMLVPVTLYLAHGMKNNLYKNGLAYRKSISTANTGLQRYLGELALFRLFGREENELEQIYESYHNQVKLNIKQTLLQQALLPIYALLAGVGVVVVIGLGRTNVSEGRWTIGNFNAYLIMFVAFTSRTRVAAKVFNRWHSARAAWVRVKEKLENAPRVHDKQFELIKSEKGIDHLHVKNLCYKINGHAILRDISFEVYSGQIIGITGPVGSGKTSLLKMLLGHYAYEGEIFINNHALHDLSEADLAKLIGYSGHEQFLFSMSLKENILLGDVYEEDALNLALKTSALIDDFDYFESGIETEVGERGQSVSGGQRQRIAMARAILKRSPIILLDDPFSALDVATERRIVNQLKASFKNQMVIIATHRLSAFEQADQVLVLDQGQIIEQGPHAVLLSQNGLYAEIYHAQQGIIGGQNEGV